MLLTEPLWDGIKASSILINLCLKHISQQTISLLLHQHLIQILETSIQMMQTYQAFTF